MRIVLAADQPLGSELSGAVKAAAKHAEFLWEPCQPFAR